LLGAGNQSLHKSRAKAKTPFSAPSKIATPVLLRDAMRARRAIVTKIAVPKFADPVIVAPVIMAPVIVGQVIVGQSRAAMAIVHPKVPAQELPASAVVSEDAVVVASAQVAADEVSAAVLAQASRSSLRRVPLCPVRRAAMAGSMNESRASSTSSMPFCTSCMLSAASSSIMGPWASTAQAVQAATASPPACHTRLLVRLIRSGKVSGSTPAACQLLRTGSMALNLAASVRLAGHPAGRAPAVLPANGTALRPRVATIPAAAIATMMTMMTVAAVSASGATMKEAFEPTPPRPSRIQRNDQRKTA
jgi:hypothetical protein